MDESALLIKKEVKEEYTKQFVSLGELFIADKPTHVWTVLGSCVSVILHDPRKRISAVCHAQLTEKGIVDKDSNYQASEKDDFRYVACAIHHMVNQMLSRGIKKSEIQASIYGGASIISGFSHRVGEENANAACKVIEKLGIHIIEKNIGGGKSRTIRHFTDSGFTQVKVL
jgi:chemotaxis protein CheD